jgi:hypothetical protein
MQFYKTSRAENRLGKSQGERVVVVVVVVALVGGYGLEEYEWKFFEARERK